jgi:hypothetical protein
MSDFVAGDIGAIAADPEKSYGRDFSLVVVERVYEDEDGDQRANVLTLGPDSQRIEGLRTFGSRTELEDYALEPERTDLLRKAAGDNHPLRVENGRRREPEFVDMIGWFNGVYPASDTGGDIGSSASSPRPAKRAAKKAPAGAGAGQ